MGVVAVCGLVFYVRNVDGNASFPFLRSVINGVIGSRLSKPLLT